jgi:phytoene synthase
MHQHTHTWETLLLTLASEAQRSPAFVSHVSHDTTPSIELLNAAYAYCEDVTAEHSRSFHFASRWLPPDKRQAVRALYALCRITDDIVDRPDSEVQARLHSWRQQILKPPGVINDLVTIAWTDTRLRYRIPVRYAEQLIDGVARDVYQNRYDTFGDLATYCYGVASTVGLMAMHIIGFEGSEAIPYAIKLGIALQLTNILRDVAEDWNTGRVYLPQEELAAFGLTEADLAAGYVSDNWRAFMRFQIARNLQLYDEAWPGLSLLSADGRLAIAAAADIYRAILDDIETHDYDVFSRRAHVNAKGKLWRLLNLWWQGKRDALALPFSVRGSQASQQR